VDVKFVAPIGGTRRKHYQFTAIDDCTRLRVLRVYDHLNQKTAIQFIDYVFEKLPFRVEVIQTDNGAEFQSAFHWHVLDRGVQHVYIKPATPRLNGKVERSHRIDADEFYRLLDGVVLDDARLFTTKLQEWEDFYNFDRPHGGLGGQTPYERLRQKTGALCYRPPSVAHLTLRVEQHTAGVCGSEHLGRRCAGFQVSIPTMRVQRGQMSEHSQFRRDLFRGTAEYYDRYRPGYPQPLIDDLVRRASIREHGSLLDLACGTGQITFAMQAHFDEVCALDQEPEMAEFVHSKAIRAGLRHVRCVTASAEDLEVSEASVELIAIGNAYHRLQRRTVAANALRWLRPGACLALLWGRRSLAG